MTKTTIADLLDAVDKINKFVKFGERVGRIIGQLASAGIDISRINPYDINSLISIAVRLRSQGYNVENLDVEELREEFREILEMDLDEINKANRTIRRFISTYKSASSTLSVVNRTVGVGLDQMQALAQLFGLKVGKGEKVGEEEIEEIEELEDEEIEELREAIRQFKNKR